MFALVLITLSAVASSISCTCQIPSKLLVGLPTLVVAALTDPSLSFVLKDAIPRLMMFGFRVKTALLLRFIPQLEFMSRLGTGANLQPTTLLKMGLRHLSSAKNLSMEVLSFFAFLIHWGLKGTIGLIISWFLFRLGESVILWQIWTEEVNLTSAMVVFPPCGVVLSLPFLLTSLWVWKVCTSLCTASVTISFQDNRLVRVQSLSDYRHILHDSLANQTDCAWDDLWDDLVEDWFVWRISVGNVISYLWITIWIAFYVIFLWIVDCWLNRQFVKSIYRFYQHVQRISPLTCHVCNIFLWWWNGGMDTCHVWNLSLWWWNGGMVIFHVFNLSLWWRNGGMVIFHVFNISLWWWNGAMVKWYPYSHDWRYVQRQVLPLTFLPWLC